MSGIESDLHCCDAQSVLCGGIGSNPSTHPGQADRTATLDVPVNREVAHGVYSSIAHFGPKQPLIMGIASKLKLFWTAGRGVVTGMAEATESADPIELFGNWFTAATDSGILLPEAMTLSTATPGGIPSSRMVLLKGYGPDGFVFFTNYGSKKASELDENPVAALLFHWPILQRQVRIEGRVGKISEAESSAYFATRDRGSQVGAWASRQSEELENRSELEKRVKEVETRFEGNDVPRPAFWGGYRVSPIAIEFWQGRVSRLHDRVRFARDADHWHATRLYP